MNFIKASYGDTDEDDEKDASKSNHLTETKGENLNFSVAPFVHPTVATNEGEVS